MPSSESILQIAPSEDLEDLYENSPCGYLSLSSENRIAKANQTFCRWTGYAQDELLGKKFHDFLGVAGRIFFETHVSPLLRMQGFFNEVAFDFVANDGTKIAVLANASERRTENGGLLFTRLTVFLATERRRYERQLVEARDVAVKGLLAEKEVAELREQFIAVLGHDLRNPLASIGSAVTLLKKETLSARGKQIIALSEDSVQRMATLIDNVLDFARGRLGGGIGLLAAAHNDLSASLLHVVNELRSARPEAKIETSILVDVPVYCDQGRIGQVLSNLLGNAITHGDMSEPIVVHAETNGGAFELWVSNRGTPIEASAKERLFQPFFRGEVRHSQQGLGLGLHIASEIAKAHGGTLTVLSSNEETRFTFRMPVLPDWIKVSPGGETL